MSTVTFQDKLDDVYAKTSDVFAEQEVQNYEETVNNFLDFINDCSEKLMVINKEYESLLDSFVAELSHVENKKELILMREKANPLFNLSRRLIKTINSNPPYRNGLKAVLADFQIYVEDLRELLSDIDKRLTENKRINNILKEIVDLKSWLLVYSTNSYRRSIANLTKKKRLKHYQCVKAEVTSLIQENSFQEIWEMNTHLRSVEHLRVYKIRLPNPTMKKGKSGGFRLILLLDSQNQDIVLLYIYPKTGAMAKKDLEEGEEEKILRHFLEEIKEESLKEYTGWTYINYSKEKFFKVYRFHQA